MNTKRAPWDDENWNDAAANQGGQGLPADHRELGRGQEVSPLPFQGAWPCGHWPAGLRNSPHLVL